MFEYIQEIDRVLFEFFNGRLTNSFLDFIMPYVTNAYTWIPLYIGMIIYFIYRYKKLFLIPLMGVLMSFGVADSVSAKILKSSVKRTRPCNETTVNSRVVGVDCRDSYSFPSSHASNHFAISLFMIFLLGTRKRFGLGFWLIWAALVSYSRVYVGVHYPFDLLAGAILGSLIGMTIALMVNNLLKRLQDEEEPEDADL